VIPNPFYWYCRQIIISSNLGAFAMPLSTLQAQPKRAV
jgi:hypothetical protein